MREALKPNKVQPDPYLDRKAVWYSPAEIRFTWEQVQWMIINILPLDPGKWLPEPVESGYVGGNKLPGQHAPYEAACMVVGGLRVRLKRTGTAGKLLVAQLQADRGWELDYEAKMACAYCCGNRRKRLNYRDWLWQTEARRVDKMKGKTLQRA